MKMYDVFSLVLILILIVIILDVISKFMGWRKSTSGSQKIEYYGPPPGICSPADPYLMGCYKSPNVGIGQYSLQAPSGKLAIEQTKKYYTQTPECYRGWESGPLEYQANSASSISHMMERSA